MVKNFNFNYYKTVSGFDIVIDQINKNNRLHVYFSGFP